MKQKINTRWITQTAVMIALLLALQWTTSFIPKPIQQFVTGSCVNAILAIAALMLSCSSSVTVAILSPIFAFLLGIAPNIVTVPAIMLGNVAYVLLFRLAREKALPHKICFWALASIVKFALLYFVVAVIICGAASEALLAEGILKDPMLQMLPATFSWPQLITALIGGGISLAITPVLTKAVHKN